VVKNNCKDGSLNSLFLKFAENLGIASFFTVIVGTMKTSIYTVIFLYKKLPLRLNKKSSDTSYIEKKII
jgi:hypothetical protein